MERDIMGNANLPPEQTWDEEDPEVHHFLYRSHLMELTSAITLLTIEFGKNNPYNSITSAIRFYDDYRSQSKLSLEEFYNNSLGIEIKEDSLCCVGTALMLRRAILEKLGARFPYLERKMYLTTAMFYPFSELPERFKDGPPLHHGPNKEHTALAFKFTLSECGLKKGVLIIDMGYLMSFPLVVMEDGQPPHTGVFEMVRGKGRHTMELLWISDNYVRWKFMKPLLDGTGEYETEYQWFFIGKKVCNPRQIERRNLVAVFHGYLCSAVAGLQCAAFSILGSENPLEIYYMEDGDVYRQVSAWPSYFLEGQTDDPEVEKALGELAQYSPDKSLQDVRNLLTRWATLSEDKAFLAELVSINDCILEKNKDYE